MSKYKSFIKKMPLSFLRACQLTTPIRYAEVFALYHILSNEVLFHHIKDSLYFTEDEQRLQDADIFAKKNSMDGIDHMPTVSLMVGFTIDKCINILDRCEAICTYRNMNGYDPIPPRTYPNIFEEEL